MPRRLALVLVAPLAGCAPRRTVEMRRETSGPFTIEMRLVRIASGAFPNISGNPFATMLVTYFALEADDRPLTVGSGDSIRDEFWEARFLAGAPRPAVLFADTGMYLATERDGRARGDDTALATIDGITLTVWWRPDAREVALVARQTPTGSMQPAYALVARVAARVDEELRAGRHQELFTSWEGPE